MNLDEGRCLTNLNKQVETSITKDHIGDLKNPIIKYLSWKHGSTGAKKPVLFVYVCRKRLVKYGGSFLLFEPWTELLTELFGLLELFNRPLDYWGIYLGSH